MYAVLLYGNPGRHVHNRIKQYGNLSSCRRRFIFHDFLFHTNEIVVVGCACCDNCSRVCKCLKCVS